MRGVELASPGDIAITAIGVATPLGGACTTAAGCRAGLSRFATIIGQTVLDESTGELVPVVGSEVSAVAGFGGMGRLAFLAALALRDLFRTAPERPATIVLGFPDAADRFLTSDEQDDERSDVQAQMRDQAARIAATVPALLGSTFQASEITAHPISGADFATLLDMALARLDGGACRRCIVGAVDSLLDVDVLEHLANQGRLKGPGNPAAILPGEGAAFLCLERAGGGSGSFALATLAKWVSVAPEDAAGPEAAWADAVLQSLDQPGERPLLIVDHSGEEARAREFGGVLVRMGVTRAELASCAAWFPATSLGDLGVAFEPLAAALACRGWARGYSPARSALVMASSPHGRRSALRVDAPASTRPGNDGV